MPILETPPNPAPPEPPRQETASSKVRTRQFGELDHTELIHLLDALDDERERARFRESIYISLFVWVGIAALLLFLPRYLPRQPRFITPGTETEEHQLTHLDIPPDVQRALDHPPRFKAAPKVPIQSRIPQSASPAPAAPPPQAQVQKQPQQQAAPQPAAPPPQQPVVRESPLPQPRPAPQQNTAALPSAPAPSSATRPNFGNPNISARDMVQQAGRAPRGGGLDDGPSGGGVRHGLGAGAEILSDTQGVDFNEYLKKILHEIRSTWEPLIPEEAMPPLNKQGESQIRFTILPDGQIGGMTLEWSTHDDAINKSCWGSITGVGQFPPLPAQFHGPNLELRIHYLVNKEQR